MPNFIVGEKVLTPAEELRVGQIKEWQLLFDNAYDDLTKMVVSPEQVKKEGDDYWLQMGAALPGLISKVSGDFLFGEPPILKSDDEANQEFAEEYFNESFIEQLYQGAVTQSSDGGVVLKLFTVPDPDKPEKPLPRIQILSQKCYFPTFERFTNIITAVDLITLQPKDDHTSWMLREHHEPGMVTFEEYIIDTDSGKIKEVVNGSFREEPTGLGVIPLCYLPNFQQLDSYWGRSDYAGVEAIFVAINRRMTQNDHSLFTHGGPKLQGPGENKGILNEFGNPMKKTTLDYLAIPMSQVGGKFADYKYLQQELATTEDLDTIKMLLKFAFLLTDISPDVFGLGEGQADSGKALRLRLLRTLTMIRRKARLWSIGLTKIINLAMSILGIEPDYTLIFQDGLPTDMEELIDQQEQMLNSGLTSQKDAIQAIHGYDDDAADKKLVEIREDNVAKQSAFNAGISI